MRLPSNVCVPRRLFGNFQSMPDWHELPRGRQRDELEHIGDRMIGRARRVLENIADGKPIDTRGWFTLDYVIFGDPANVEKARANAEWVLSFYGAQD